MAGERARLCACAVILSLMKSMAGRTVARLGVEQEKYNIASFKTYHVNDESAFCGILHITCLEDFAQLGCYCPFLLAQLIVSKVVLPISC